MTRHIATQATTFALAVAMTLAMLGATNALAAHQVRVAQAAAQSRNVVVTEVQQVTVVAHHLAA